MSQIFILFFFSFIPNTKKHEMQKKKKNTINTNTSDQTTPKLNIHYYALASIILKKVKILVVVAPLGFVSMYCAGSDDRTTHKNLMVMANISVHEQLCILYS